MCVAQYAAVEYPPRELSLSNFAAVEYPPLELSRRTIGLGILQELFTCNLRYFIVSAIYEELMPSVLSNDIFSIEKPYL